MTIKAVVYQESKSAGQSGLARTSGYKVRFVDSETSAQKSEFNPMMWTYSADVLSQIVLKLFETKEDAVRYLYSLGIMYEVENANKKLLRKKSYADNFR